MSLAELLPEVEALPRSDKFRLVRLLMDVLERQDEVALEESMITVGGTYPVWSPLDAYAAADAMENLLKQEAAVTK